MRRFHWEKIGGSCKQAAATSFWSKIDEFNVDIDYEALETLFGAKKSKSAREAKKALKTEEASIQTEVKLLDSRRAYNVNIVLARQRYTHEDIKAAILSVDESVLTPERVLQLKNISPTEEEIDVLKAYADSGGKLHQLGSAERFFAVMASIPRVSSRLDILAFKQGYATNLEGIHVSIGTVRKAIQQIQNSAGLNEAFGVLLAIGNFMNSGTAKGKARGFSIGSLERLSLAKTNDNKMNLLEYLVRFADGHAPKILQMYKELDTVKQAGRVEFSKVGGMVQTIVQRVATLKTELALIAKPNKMFQIFNRVKTFKRDQFVVKVTPFYEMAKKKTDELEQVVRGLVSLFSFFNILRI